MDKLNIWDNDRLKRKIALCIDKKYVRKHVEKKKYKFPLSDILFTFYKDAVVTENFYSVNSLERILNDYCGKQEKLNVSVEQLVQEGWISVAFGRWTSALGNLHTWDKVGYVREEEFPDAAMIRFLIWLEKEAKIHSLNVEIIKPDETLNCWRAVCTDTPELQWFVDKHLLVQNADRYYAYYGGYSWNPDVYRALARLWLEWNDNEREKWLKVARSLNGTYQISDYLEHDLEERLLCLLMECFYQYPVPSWKNENAFYQKLRMLEVPEYCKNPEKYGHVELWTGNRVIDTLTYNSYGFEHYHWCGTKNQDYYLFLGSLLTHLNYKEDIKFSAYLNDYDKIGALYLMPELEADDIYELLVTKETMFLGFRYLIHDIGGSVLSQDDYVQHIVNIMSTIFEESSRYIGYISAEEFGMCLFYLQKQSDGKSNGYRMLLVELLKRLGNQKYLDIFGSEISIYFRELMRIKNDVDWVKGFHLILLCVNQWFCLNPKMQEKGYFKEILDIVWYGYQMVFDGKSNYVAYLKEEYFSKELCDLLYRTYIRDNGTEKRRKLLLPKEHLHYSEKNNQIYEFYRLLLGILSHIYEAEEQKDETVKSVLLETLEQVLLKGEASEERPIFDYTYMQIFSTEDIIKKCIGILQYDNAETKYLVKQLLNGKIPELLVYYEAATDEKFKDALLDQINEKAKVDSLDVFHDEHALDLVMNHKIESLYPAVAHSLERKFEYWDKGNCPKQNDYYQKAIHQKWRLKYCQGLYSEILEGDNLFFQAIVYTAVEKYKNFDNANCIWKRMIEQRDQNNYASTVYLNYFYLLNRELEYQKSEKTEKYFNILEQIKWLMNIIENEQIKRWTNEESDSYGWMVVQSKKIQEKDYLQELYFYKRKYNLSLTAELFVERMSEMTEIKVEKWQKEYTDIDIANALRAFEALEREPKGWIYYQVAGIKNQPGVDMGTAILVEEVLRTCCALQNYGPQLIYEDKLYEDGVTELFREMFNLAFGKIYGFTVHDQEKRANTGMISHGTKSPAEIDLSVYYKDNCNEIMEAFVLKDNNSKSIFKDHMEKVIGNNIAHQTLSFMLVYGNARDSNKEWNKYRKYLENMMIADFTGTTVTKSELLEVKEAPYYLEEFENKFHGLQLLRQRIELDCGDRQEILHVFIDIAKNAEGKIRKKAR